MGLILHKASDDNRVKKIFFFSTTLPRLIHITYFFLAERMRGADHRFKLKPGFGGL